MADTKLLQGAIGFESTPGTGVTVTQLLAGDLRYTYELERRWLGRAAGVRLTSTGSYVDVRRLGRWSFDSRDRGICFEEIPGFLACGLEGITTGTFVASGAGGSIYSWVFTGSLTASPAIKTATINLWDENTCALEAPYGVVQEFRLSGAPGELARATANIFSRSASPTPTKDTVTASTNLVPLVGGNTRIYFASTWAGLSTAASTSGLLRDWDVLIRTGMIPKFFADGTVEFSRPGAMGDFGLELSGVYEFDNSGASQFNDFLNSPTKFVKLRIEGPATGESASRYIQLQMAVGYTSVEPWSGEVDGNATGTFRMRTFFDTVSGSCFAASINCGRKAL